MKNFLINLLVTSMVIACSSDDEKEDPIVIVDPEPLQEEAILNVPYGTDPRQVYDIYLPTSRTETNTKVLILIHGGGWIGGQKEDMNGFVNAIRDARPKLAVVNMNYILADESHKAYPNQLQDIDKMIADLNAKKTEYQISSTFGFLGLSAGAHLSMLYSYAWSEAKDIRMVASVVGPTDFTDPAYTSNIQFQQAFSVLVDDYDPGNTDVLELVSPSYQVNPQSPPTIMFYGNQDELIPNYQHESLKKSLEENNVVHDLTVYNGGHGNWSAESYLDLSLKLQQFIDEHLLKD